MTSSQAAASSPKSFSELETENYSLRLKLEEAERRIGAYERDAVGLTERQQKSDARLKMELADTKLLQSISAHLIHEEHVDTLYEKITEAALTIMQSDFASLQRYYPERGKSGQLRLIASSGLSEEGQDFWAWVDVDSGTTCAVAMRTGKRFISSDMHTCEYVVNTPDHEMFVRAGVLAAQSTPLFSRRGKLLGMISTHWTRNHTSSDRDLNLLDILARQAADLIERKAAEDALRRSREALIHADHRKDEFLATLGHELRNPLAPIRNALSIMSIEPDGSKAPDLLAMMDRQVTHLVRLVDDLLDVSRIRQGKIELRKERIALQNAIRDAVEVSSQLIENSSHRLTLDIPEEPIWVHADLTRVAQVISNLLNNAAKYTPTGGHINVFVRPEGSDAVLSVSDNGVGIPTDMLPNVFDLFTQVDRNLERSRGGLGIGLAVVKQLLDMHDGEIEVKSLGLNQGSTFTIRLPIVTSAASHAPTNELPKQPKSTSTGQTLKILVVDDNIDSAETIGALLEMHGHETKLAHDGKEALIFASDYCPDVILLDIDLPSMNGHDVCRELRKNSLFKNTLVIAQTGFGQDRDRHLAQDAGFNHHLVKPFDFAQLLQLLEHSTR